MESVKRFVYGYPKQPPRIRTKPLAVICVGLPRSATESLSVALEKLGYKTYHGWDLGLEENAAYTQQWAYLAKRKWNGAPDGDVHITSAEFDALLGHCDVVIDSAASFFAAQLIEAYPDAKVILNTRRDLDAWHRSILKTIVQEVEDRWIVRIMRFFNAGMFWSWEVFMTHGYPGLFQSARSGNARAGIECNGKWVYREHSNMIRGLVPKERLLEWSAEDGWEPVCEFLDKPVPDEPFPRVNDLSAFKGNVEAKLIRPRIMGAVRNLLITVASVGVLTTAIVLGVKQRRVAWA
ncbi:P-loop containing nucleoside triphosphate hydrolase protein [Aspergillus alliaceus]|uniref:P-loop containing nucleoside triphosphate hydrolase protein n=1 Tax=Petromyces alliaceus TaxID=209559 RepID=A0A5N7BYW8_PETAA|nr:P-loop containing nucleoside triphosphate hydrolase protein [Aspergillus alliaceus]